MATERIKNNLTKSKNPYGKLLYLSEAVGIPRRKNKKQKRSGRARGEQAESKDTYARTIVRGKDL